MKQNDNMTNGASRMLAAGTGIPAGNEALAETAEIEVAIPIEVALEMPEEDKEAEDTKIAQELGLIREKGLFSPVLGMANIRNVLGNRIYARIFENGKGVRFIEFCQEYGDGSFSPKMQIPQADIRIAATFKFISKDIPENKLRNKIACFIMDTYDGYAGTFKGKDADWIDVKDILNVLVRAMSSLPVCTDAPGAASPEKFYQAVVHYIDDINTLWLKDHKSYFSLDDSIINSVAMKMGMKPLELLRKLREHGFLYLTPSSRGYQTNVRFTSGSHTFTEWTYCVYRPEYLAGKISEDAMGQDEASAILF